MSEGTFIIRVSPDAMQVMSRNETRVLLSVVPDGILPESDAIDFFNEGVSQMVQNLMGYDSETRFYNRAKSLMAMLNKAMEEVKA